MYVSIENSRISNSIVFSLNVDDSLEINRIMIPSLLSQPFIENAIWHGLSPKRGVKELTINIYLKKKSHFAIEIIDNGIGRKRAMKIKESRTFKRTSIGIQLSKERLLDFSRNLKSTYNLQFVDLFDLQGKALGTKVIIEIPIKFIKNEISS
jgi:sensor histidine kinase YesM